MKYNRGKYNQFIYGTFFGQADYTKIADKFTNYTAPIVINTNWGIGNRHRYGYVAETNRRGTYGEYLRYGGLRKVGYKFIGNTDFSSDY
jgi:hypothetical protein